MRSLLLCNRGNITLYALFCLPVVLTLSIVGVDMAGWQAKRELLQRESDRIAMMAAKALPDVGAAQQIIQSAIQSESQITSFELQSSSSEIALTLHGRLDSSFDTFLKQYTGTEQTFPVVQRSVVQVVPTDYVLVISDSGSLRPNADETPWGDETAWPASNYFSMSAPIPLAPGAVLPSPQDTKAWPTWRADWNETRYRRWATQSCFNPVFSSLKFAAITLSDVLGGSTTNRVAAIFTPGDDPLLGYSYARPLKFHNETPEREARWSNYFETDNYLSDELCAYLANPLISGNDERYELPHAPNYFGLPSAGRAECENEFADGATFAEHFPSGKLSSCFANSNNSEAQGLSLREALYFHMARRHGHAADGSNIIRALQQAYITIGNVELNPETFASLALPNRGKAAYVSRRAIILLTDMLPNPADADFIQLIEHLNNNNIDLIAAVLDRSGALAARIAMWRELASEPHVRLRVYSVTDPEKLLTDVIPNVIEHGREVTVKS